jgi:hypothetical protein
MNSLIKYGLYFVVVFSVLAFGAAEDGKDRGPARRTGSHPGEMRSDKLNATRCDSVNLTRQAVTSEFHRAGKSEGQEQGIKDEHRTSNVQHRMKR